MPCNCPPFPLRPEPFSPAPRPFPAPDHAAWLKAQLALKADKPGGAAAGNLASLAEDGNLADSGLAAQSVADAVEQAETAYQKPEDGIPKTDLEEEVQASLDKADFAYQKPEGGVPKTDLSEDVQASLDNADTAVQPAAIAGFVDGAEYDADYGDPPKPTILLKHGSEVVATVDAADFVIDGMVSNVGVKNGYLVITFNTDSGKQPISIPLTDIFNPDDYYTKTDVNGLLAGKQPKITASGVLKGDGTGGVSAAAAGTDYQAPLTAQQLANIAAVPNKADASDMDVALSQKQDRYTAWTVTISPPYGFEIEAIGQPYWDSSYEEGAWALKFRYREDGGEWSESMEHASGGGLDATSIDSGIFSATRSVVIDGKANRASPTTSGNLAALDANGNPMDSGKQPADFATAAQGQKADDSVQRVSDNANPSAKTAVTIGVRSTENTADRGQASLAVGDHPKASGKNAVATGTWTQATGQDAHAEGNLGQATNYGAHAEGNNTRASGPFAHTEGSDTAAPGLVAHAEGNYTTAPGTGAHTEGMFTKASGPGAHAEGSNLDRLADLLQTAGASAEIVALFRQAATAAAGSFSHTEGLVSATSEMGSHAQGFRASDGGNQFSFVWQGYSGPVPTAAQMQALLDDPTSQDAQVALQCLVTALNARDVYASKGPGTFCINPTPQGGNTDPKSGLFVGAESLDKMLRYSFHTASQSTLHGYWNITEVPSGVDSSDIDIYWDSDYEDWCILNISTGDSYFIGRHDENDKSPISYDGYVADWVVTQRIYDLADRAINSATLGSSVTVAAVTLPVATAGYSRDFFIDLTIEATTAPTLTFIDPATNAAINVAFGADALADIDTGYNLILFTELPNNRWLASVKHEEVSA